MGYSPLLVDHDQNYVDYYTHDGRALNVSSELGLRVATNNTGDYELSGAVTDPDDIKLLTNNKTLTEEQLFYIGVQYDSSISNNIGYIYNTAQLMMRDAIQSECDDDIKLVLDLLRI